MLGNGQVVVASTVLFGLFFGLGAYAMLAAKWLFAPVAAHGLGFTAMQKLQYMIGAVTITLTTQLSYGGRIIEFFGYRDACVACLWFAASFYFLHGLSSYVFAVSAGLGWTVLLLSEGLRRLFQMESTICAVRVAADAVPKELQVPRAALRPRDCARRARDALRLRLWPRCVTCAHRLPRARVRAVRRTCTTSGHRTWRIGACITCPARARGGTVR